MQLESFMVIPSNHHDPKVITYLLTEDSRQIKQFRDIDYISPISMVLGLVSVSYSIIFAHTTHTHTHGNKCITHTNAASWQQLQPFFLTCLVLFVLQ